MGSRLTLGVFTSIRLRRSVVNEQYEGQQYVGIDLHRRRSVMVRMTAAGERLETLHLDNDPLELGLALRRAGEDPQVVLEATYGWYWAADVLAEAGAQVHLAHPLGSRVSRIGG